MKDDPIVEEIRSIRAAHTAKYGNDIDRIFAAIKKGEKKYLNKLVNREKSRSHEKQIKRDRLL